MEADSDKMMANSGEIAAKEQRNNANLTSKYRQDVRVRKRVAPNFQGLVIF